MKERVSFTEVRKDLAEYLNRSAYRREWIIVERRGKEMGAIISMEDLRLLEQAIEEKEDKTDQYMARESITAYEAGDTSSLDDVIKELDLDV